MSKMVIALVTAPDLQTARNLGRALVESQLAACANLVPGLTSIYRWEGVVQEDAEVLMIIKTRPEAIEQLREQVVALHPYDVPEFIVLPVTDGSDAYIQWVLSSVHGDNGL